MQRQRSWVIASSSHLDALAHLSGKISKCLRIRNRNFNWTCVAAFPTRKWFPGRLWNFWFRKVFEHIPPIGYETYYSEMFWNMSYREDLKVAARSNPKSWGHALLHFHKTNSSERFRNIFLRKAFEHILPTRFWYMVLRKFSHQLLPMSFKTYYPNWDVEDWSTE